MCRVCRPSPLFVLCRPAVLLEKKELALFRLFEGLESLKTYPYAFHLNACMGLPYGETPSNPHLSVRWMLQQFLADIHKSNSASFHNLSAAVKRLEDPLNDADIPEDQCASPLGAACTLRGKRRAAARP